MVQMQCPSSAPLEKMPSTQRKNEKTKHAEGSPWPGGSAWISQRFRVAPSGGCSGGRRPGWRTGFWLGCCRPLVKHNPVVTD